jgi:hypothetical protein
VWITDMEVSRPPPPGNDPKKWRTYYYRIQSTGSEQPQGLGLPQGTRGTEQVIGVVYMR